MKGIGFIVLLALAFPALALAQTPHQIDIGWDTPAESPSEIVSYEVCYNSDVAVTEDDPCLNVGLVNEFTYPAEGLPGPDADDQYFVAVKSCNVDAICNPEGPISIQIIIEFPEPEPAPAAPENVRIIDVREVEAPPEPEVQTFRIQAE